MPADSRDMVLVPRDSWGRPFSKYSHGESSAHVRTKEYRVWAHIKGRCRNPTDGGYHLYGARGITVCDKWADSFEVFLADVGRAPSPRHSLDRIDNERGYEPGNVRWATQAEQARNTRRTIKVGDVALIDYCAANGLSYDAVQARLRRGHPMSLAISPLTGAAYRRAAAEALRHD